MTLAAMKRIFDAMRAAYTYGTFPEDSGIKKLLHDAVNEQRAAIAEQEKCEPVAWQHRQRGPAEENWQEWRTVGHMPQGPESRTFQMRPLYTHPAPVPAGWQLVPVEPTKAMLSAGWGNDHLYADLYKAMLAAAPKPGENHD
mgnify:CR=1 FL=1